MFTDVPCCKNLSLFSTYLLKNIFNISYCIIDGHVIRPPKSRYKKKKCGCILLFLVVDNSRILFAENEISIN